METNNNTLPVSTDNNKVEPNQLRQVLEKMWTTNWRPHSLTNFLVMSEVKTFLEGCVRCP